MISNIKKWVQNAVDSTLMLDELVSNIESNQYANKNVIINNLSDQKDSKTLKPNRNSSIVNESTNGVKRLSTSTFYVSQNDEVLPNYRSKSASTLDSNEASSRKQDIFDPGTFNAAQFRHSIAICSNSNSVVSSGRVSRNEFDESVDLSYLSAEEQSKIEIVLRRAREEDKHEKRKLSEPFIILPGSERDQENNHLSISNKTANRSHSISFVGYASTGKLESSNSYSITPNPIQAKLNLPTSSSRHIRKISLQTIESIEKYKKSLNKYKRKSNNSSQDVLFKALSLSSRLNSKSDVNNNTSSIGNSNYCSICRISMFTNYSNININLSRTCSACSRFVCNECSIVSVISERAKADAKKKTTDKSVSNLSSKFGLVCKPCSKRQEQMMTSDNKNSININVDNEFCSDENDYSSIFYAGEVINSCDDEYRQVRRRHYEKAFENNINTRQHKHQQEKINQNSVSDISQEFSFENANQKKRNDYKSKSISQVTFEFNSNGDNKKEEHQQNIDTPQHDGTVNKTATNNSYRTVKLPTSTNNMDTNSMNKLTLNSNSKRRRLPFTPSCHETNLRDCLSVPNTTPNSAQPSLHASNFSITNIHGTPRIATSLSSNSDTCGTNQILVKLNEQLETLNHDIRTQISPKAAVKGIDFRKNSSPAAVVIKNELIPNQHVNEWLNKNSIADSSSKTLKISNTETNDANATTGGSSGGHSSSLLSKQQSFRSHSIAVPVRVIADEPLIEINLNRNFYAKKQLQQIASVDCDSIHPSSHYNNNIVGLNNNISNFQTVLKSTSSSCYNTSNLMQSSNGDVIQKICVYKNPKEMMTTAECSPDELFDGFSRQRRPSNSLGIDILARQRLGDSGGASLAAVVGAVHPDGLMDQYRVDIQCGDEILEINGVALRNKNDEQIESILDSSCQTNQGEIELVVRRSSLTKTTVSNNISQNNDDQMVQDAYEIQSGDAISPVSSEIAIPKGNHNKHQQHKPRPQLQSQYSITSSSSSSSSSILSNLNATSTTITSSSFQPQTSVSSTSSGKQLVKQKNLNYIEENSSLDLAEPHEQQDFYMKQREQNERNLCDGSVGRSKQTNGHHTPYSVKNISEEAVQGEGRGFREISIKRKTGGFGYNSGATSKLDTLFSDPALLYAVAEQQHRRKSNNETVLKNQINELNQKSFPNVDRNSNYNVKSQNYIYQNDANANQQQYLLNVSSNCHSYDNTSNSSNSPASISPKTSEVIMEINNNHTNNGNTSQVKKARERTITTVSSSSVEETAIFSIPSHRKSDITPSSISTSSNLTAKCPSGFNLNQYRSNSPSVKKDRDSGFSQSQTPESVAQNMLGPVRLQHRRYSSNLNVGSALNLTSCDMNSTETRRKLSFDPGMNSAQSSAQSSPKQYKDDTDSPCSERSQNDVSLIKTKLLPLNNDTGAPMTLNGDTNADDGLVNIGNSSANLGDLQLQLTHKENEQTLIIKILKARNLIAKDANGFSDPFVKVYLLPGRDQENKRRTKHVIKNLNPEWNCILTYPNLYKEELKYKTLELTVWDWDRFKSNDFLGMVKIELNDCKYLDDKPHWFKLKNSLYVEEIMSEKNANSALKRQSGSKKSYKKKANN